MPQKTNLNVAPYYDDFAQDKNFYKVLFRPGYSIQARELTQLQSSLQNQIESFGKYAFKQGELVIPGEVALNTKLNFVKLSSVSEIPTNVDGNIVYKKYDISLLKGQQLKGLTSGVVASVIETSKATETTSDVVYVNYINSGNAGNEETFRQGETLEVVDGVNTPLLVVGTDGSVLPTSISVTNPDTGEVSSLISNAMGFASAVKVEEGIYFVNGYFVRNSSQLLVIDKYYDQPSTKVGFKITESIVLSETDESLYDNAIGSTNYSAPGADRLKIDLTLTQYGYTATTDKNFIQLLTIKSGAVQSQVIPTDYNLIENTLARRTYDESGDYVVDDFSIDIREYLQTDGNLGVYSADSVTGLVNGFTTTVAAEKLLASIGPGKAYVKGYEIVNKETKNLVVNKARETLNRSDIRLKSGGLPTYKVNNTFGTVPLNAEGSDLTSYPNIFLCANFNDGSIGLNNTEAVTDAKQTTDRRGTFFDIDTGIKTIYVKIDSSVNIDNIGGVATTDNDSRLTAISNLWFVVNRTNTGAPSVVANVSGIGLSIVSRVEVDSNTSNTFMEVTVSGKKNYLDEFLLEYDGGDSDNNRKLFLTENDAKNGSATEFATIVDYNETITPVIGLAKPSNVTLIEKGSGFNSDIDVVVSKGRQSNGSAVYNTTFGLSYFDPQFFTKLSLDEPISVTGSFGNGQYVYGLQSGAYGVIEGATDKAFSSNKTLMVKTLFGTFQSGEPIRDEGNNTLRIRKDNTISHFIVANRGSYYNPGTK